MQGKKSRVGKVPPHPVTNLNCNELEPVPQNQPCLLKRGLVEDGEVVRLLDELGVQVKVEV